MKLAAYLQLYKNDGKGDLILSFFRKIYPDAYVYVVSDNGDDFTEICKKHGCIYEHSLYNTGVKNHGFTKQDALIWLKRFYNCCLNSRSDYVLYLEDDVLIRKHIDIDAVIAGVMVGNYIPASAVDYLENKFNIKFAHRQYGACGGTIYKTQIFLDNYTKFVRFIEDELENLQNFDINAGSLDKMMVILYNMIGETFVQNPELIETGRNPNWRESTHAIVHINGDRADIYEELRNGAR